MRVLKERVLHRVKAYTPAQLFDIVRLYFDQYYSEKLLDIANRRPPNYLKYAENALSSRISDLSVTKLHGKEFDVFNSCIVRKRTL